MDYATLMHDLFYTCVLLLRWGAIKLGMTYEELNIWIFVVIHPLLTAYFMWLTFKWKKRAHKLHIQQLHYIDTSKM